MLLRKRDVLWYGDAARALAVPAMLGGGGRGQQPFLPPCTGQHQSTPERARD